MWRGLLLVGFLAADTQAFNPAPILWGGRPGKKLFLVSPVSLDGITTPQQLTLKGASGRISHNEIQYFTTNQDNTIACDDSDMRWCLEASGTEHGHVVRVNHCTGGPAQKWRWLPGGPIQLEGTNQCIHVNDDDGLTRVQVELSECANKVTDTWTFQYTTLAPARSSLQSFTPSLFCIGVAMMIATLSLGAWLSRWQEEARVVVATKDRVFLNMDQGGVCMIEPMDVRLIDMPLAAARNFCGGNGDRCSPRRFDTNELKMTLPSAEDQQSHDAGLQNINRRSAILQSVVSCSLLAISPELMSPAIADVPIDVGPASNFNRIQTGKPRPETGCVLVEAVQSTGDSKSPTISAELVTNGGVAATVAFDSPWPVARGMYYDIEARSQKGDSAYVHVRSLPGDKDVMAVPSSYLTSSVFNAYGRWSTYGEPTDIKILSDVSKGGTRFLEVTFSVLSQAGGDSPRRGFVAAVQPAGSSDAVMLVSSASDFRWKEKGADVRQVVESFRVVGTRATKAARAASSDYRFEERGGLLKGTTDTVQDQLSQLY